MEDAETLLGSLTAGERECLRGVLRLHKSEQIAEYTNLSPNTVNTYLQNAKRKLRASTRRDAAIRHAELEQQVSQKLRYELLDIDSECDSPSFWSGQRQRLPNAVRNTEQTQPVIPAPIRDPLPQPGGEHHDLTTVQRLTQIMLWVVSIPVGIAIIAGILTIIFGFYELGNPALLRLYEALFNNR